MRNVNVAVEVKIPSATKVKAHSVCIFNRLSKEGDYTVRLYIYFLIDQYFFEECSDFDIFSFFGTMVARSKNILKPHLVNFSACLLSTLFGYNLIRQWPENFGIFLNYIGLLCI